MEGRVHELAERVGTQGGVGGEKAQEGILPSLLRAPEKQEKKVKSFERSR